MSCHTNPSLVPILYQVNPVSTLTQCRVTRTRHSSLSSTRLIQSALLFNVVSHEPVTRPYPLPDQSSQHSYSVSCHTNPSLVPILYQVNPVSTLIQCRVTRTRHSSLSSTRSIQSALLFNVVSHEPVTRPYLRQVNPIRTTLPIYLIPILILPSHPRLNLSSGPFPSVFPTKLRNHSYLSMRATFAAYLHPPLCDHDAGAHRPRSC
jgi:hypothetical protein